MCSDTGEVPRPVDARDHARLDRPRRPEPALRARTRRLIPRHLPVWSADHRGLSAGAALPDAVGAHDHGTETALSPKVSASRAPAPLGCARSNRCSMNVNCKRHARRAYQPFRYATEPSSEMAGRQPAVIYKVKERFNRHLQNTSLACGYTRLSQASPAAHTPGLVFPPLPSFDTSTRRLGGLQQPRRSVQLHTLIQHNVASVGRVLFTSISTPAVDCDLHVDSRFVSGNGWPGLGPGGDVARRTRRASGPRRARAGRPAS